MKPYYQKHGVTIYHGDCLTVLQSLDPLEANAVLTDPPYSSGGMVRSDRTNKTTDEKYTQSEARGKRPNFHGDNMDQRAWMSFGREWLLECRRHTKLTGYLCSFIDWRQLPALTDAVQSAGWVWRGVNVWDKGQAARMPHVGYFSYQCEFVVWATNGACVKLPAMKDGGDGKLNGLCRCSVKQDDKHHQTGKPTPVMQWLTWCVPFGGLILDPFMGSGTTLVAAKKMGRKAIGIESEEGYCEVAAKRLDEMPLKVKTQTA